MWSLHTTVQRREQWQKEQVRFLSFERLPQRRRPFSLLL